MIKVLFSSMILWYNETLTISIAENCFNVSRDTTAFITRYMLPYA